MLIAVVLLNFLVAIIVSASDSVMTTRNPVADFDGDGKSDISVFRRSNGFWYVMKSSGGFSSVQWGVGTDQLVPGDYDGDGKTDRAVVRSISGISYTWYILRSSNQTFQSISFGVPGFFDLDLPTPSDYDGDGKTDLATFRFLEDPSAPQYFNILQSSNDTRAVKQWGLVSDRPIPPADYDGDGKADLAVFRNSFNGSVEEGVWYILQSSDGNMRTERFGLLSDTFVPADYDGDGKADLAVWRSSNGVWYYIKSSNGAFNGTFSSVQFGAGGDRPVQADYDGDGKTDIAVWRSSTGFWYLLKSTEGFSAHQFGYGDDLPIPGR